MRHCPHPSHVSPLFPRLPSLFSLPSRPVASRFPSLHVEWYFFVLVLSGLFFHPRGMSIRLIYTPPLANPHQPTPPPAGSHVVLVYDHWGGGTLRRFMAKRSPVASRAALPEEQVRSLFYFYLYYLAPYLASAGALSTLSLSILPSPVSCLRTNPLLACRRSTFANFHPSSHDHNLTLTVPL